MRTFIIHNIVKLIYLKKVFLFVLLFFLVNINLTLNCADAKVTSEERLDKSTQTDPINYDRELLCYRLSIYAGSYCELERIKKCMKDLFNKEPFRNIICDDPRQSFKFYSIVYSLTAEEYKNNELFTEQLKKLNINHILNFQEDIIPVEIRI